MFGKWTKQGSGCIDPIFRRDGFAKDAESHYLNAKNEDSTEPDHYSWVVVKHVFQTRATVLPINYTSIPETSPNYDPQRWEHKALNEQIAPGDKTERTDGNILYPYQKSVNIGKHSTVFGTTNSIGVHWKIMKRNSIFRGEDFFIKFRKAAFSTDIANREGSAAFLSAEKDDKLYRCLDVTNTDMCNAAIVEYDAEGNIANPASQELFDLTRQPYIIIEMRKETAPSWAYFILLTHKNKPRFIKVIDGKSYFVSEYGGKLTSKLWQSGSLKMAVRNHLGKIIITFNDDYDSPWVIENQLIKAECGTSFEGQIPPKLFCVPRCNLTIWGGNLVMGFTFSPILYNNYYVLSLPPLTEEEVSGTDINGNNIVDIADKLVIPKHAQVLLSVRESGLDKKATPSWSAGFRGEGSVANIIRKPFYVCDAQYVEEYVSDGGLSKVVKNENPYFQDFQDFIKEKTDGSCHPYTSESKLIVSKFSEEEDGVNEKFYVNIAMHSGNHQFRNGYLLENCKTPILTQVKLTNRPLVADDRWEPTSSVSNLNLSDYILSYSDSWTSQDFNTMEHSANVNFLITRGGELIPGYDAIESLQNKAFYIQVLAGYVDCNYTQMDGGEYYKLMTGICYGGSITEQAGERVMTCKVYDYSKIMKDSMIFNSPFFDGVRDINAVYELTKMTGFGETDFKPATLLRQWIDVEDFWGDEQGPDGRWIPNSSVYALPFSYGQYQGSPAFKFNDGDYVWEALQKIAQRSGKVIFFDANGLLHYEDFPIAQILYAPGDTETGGGAGDIEPLWYFTANPTSYGQLVFDKIERELSVEDVYNNILIMSTTPNRELLIADKTNKPSVDDPTSYGFLGYLKTFFQMDGIFSSEKATIQYAQHLSKFFNPPVVYKFETFGLPLRPFDIASIDGQNVIVINVSHNIIAKENKWWMSVEGEWFHGEEYIPDT